jgi:hypothetical protein
MPTVAPKIQEIPVINHKLAQVRRKRRTYHERQAALEFMTDEALDVLRELLASNNESIRLAAAKETLDRAQGKPRQVQSIDVQASDLTALHLAALRTLAANTQAIDITPNKAIVHAG